MTVQPSHVLPARYLSWIHFYESVKFYGNNLIAVPVDKGIESINPLITCPTHHVDEDVIYFDIRYIIEKAKEELFSMYLEEKSVKLEYDDLYMLRMFSSHQGSADLTCKIDILMAIERDREFKGIINKKQ